MRHKACLASPSTAVVRRSICAFASLAQKTARLRGVLIVVLAFLILPITNSGRAYAQDRPSHLSEHRRRDRRRSRHSATPTPTSTATPTSSPSPRPSPARTAVPTVAPTHVSTPRPSPIASPAPTHIPTVAPTHIPTVAPTHIPDINCDPATAVVNSHFHSNADLGGSSDF